MASWVFVPAGERSGFETLVAADREYFFPLMFLPLTGKMYDFVEEFMTRILEHGKTMIGRAKEIYLIGYRARDEIIYEILSHAQRGTVLHVVGRDSAAEILDHVLNRNNSLTKGDILNTGFMKVR